jgi:hypothetical protein
MQYNNAAKNLGFTPFQTVIFEVVFNLYAIINDITNKDKIFFV